MMIDHCDPLTESEGAIFLRRLRSRTWQFDILSTTDCQTVSERMWKNDRSCVMCISCIVHLVYLVYCVVQWHSLDRSEQARYYEMARREKLLHKQLFPGWTARDNYSVIVRRVKRKATMTQRSLQRSSNNERGLTVYLTVSDKTVVVITRL